MPDRRETFRAEALRLLEAARKAKDSASRIELSRMAATLHELGGEPPIDVDALMAQYSEPPAEAPVLQQQQIQPKKPEA
jgi:hypothetical protein